MERQDVHVHVRKEHTFEIASRRMNSFLLDNNFIWLDLHLIPAKAAERAGKGRALAKVVTAPSFSDVGSCSRPTLRMT